MSQRRVVLVAFEGAQTLDFTGPLGVFSTAERQHPGRYLVEVVAPGGLPFRTSTGLKVAPDRSTTDCRRAVDTLLVAGGTGMREAARDESLVGWLRSTAGRSRRVAWAAGPSSARRWRPNPPNAGRYGRFRTRWWPTRPAIYPWTGSPSEPA